MPKIVTDTDKKKRGTLRPCRAKKTAVAPVKMSEIVQIEAPSDLNTDGKAAWELAWKAAPKGTLTLADCSVLKRWCVAYSQYEELKRTNEGEPMVIVNKQGNVCPAPWFTMMRMLSADMLKIEKELGFTPFSRNRVNPATDDEEEKNEFDTF